MGVGRLRGLGLYTTGECTRNSTLPVHACELGTDNKQASESPQKRSRFRLEAILLSRSCHSVLQTMSCKQLWNLKVQLRYRPTVLKCKQGTPHVSR
eukprot:4201747-Amphidinium_carterae.1